MIWGQWAKTEAVCRFEQLELWKPCANYPTYPTRNALIRFSAHFNCTHFLFNIYFDRVSRGLAHSTLSVHSPSPYLFRLHFDCLQIFVVFLTSTWCNCDKMVDVPEEISVRAALAALVPLRPRYAKYLRILKTNFKSQHANKNSNNNRNSLIWRVRSSWTSRYSRHTHTHTPSIDGFRAAAN